MMSPWVSQTRADKFVGVVRPRRGILFVIPGAMKLVVATLTEASL